MTTHSVIVKPELRIHVQMFGYYILRLV